MTKTKKTTGLGKGLGALLPSIEFSDKGFKFTPSEDAPEQTGSIALVDITKVEQNPYQPRKDFDDQALEELKNSILEHGVIQPITVRVSPTGYELISGERRLRASTLAGMTKIPAYIIDVATGVEMLELALIENVQRENLNPIEVANGYQRLIEECGLTQEQVSVKVGKERSTVTNFLRLLRLPESIQESLRNREISMGHARAILALSDYKKMIIAWREVMEHGLSVRATETLVKDVELGKFRNGDSQKLTKKSLKKEEKPPVVSADIAAILEGHEKQLRHAFGTQVKINPKDLNSGTIEFEFYTPDDLDRLLDLFNSANGKA
jgi:ParB family chromosome partitioning protein